MGIGSEAVDLGARDLGKRLYSPPQIGAAAFIGTPLPACWMLAQNYTVLGKRSQARRALVYGLLGTVALLGLACILPDKFPKMPLPLAYTFAIRELAKKLQGAEVNAHLAAGGARQSNWRVLGVGVAGLALVLATFVVLVLVFPKLAGE